MLFELFSYDRELIDKGHAEGRIEGHSEGRIAGHIEVAKSLLESGMSLEEVAKHSKLSVEVIQNLVQNPEKMNQDLFN